LPKGFQDLLPEDAIARNSIIEKIRRVVESFGFLPIETPSLEYLAALIGTGGDDANKQIFKLKSPEHEDIALRFDLTVPFARFFSQYRDQLRLPFRRYHVALAWRADKPDPGRFREFTQFDFDAAGSASVALDAEIIRVLCDVMAVLGVPEYIVLVNHRRILDAILEVCGIAEAGKRKHVLRVVDKLQKIGIEEVRKELGPGRVDESGDPVKGVGIDPESIHFIERLLNVTGESRAAVLDGIQSVLPDTEQCREALSETQNFLNALESLDVDEDHVKFTPNLARGLDYYTGPVFETILREAPQFGSIMGGGRYDGLVRRFLGIDIPATGASIGIDRLLAALKQIGALTPIKTMTRVLVTVMRQDHLPYCLSIATELRRSGINTEVYFGNPDDGLGTQLAMANRLGIPVAIIVGEEELKSGNVAVKDLRAGIARRKHVTDREKYVAAGKAGQVTVRRADCVRTVQQILASF